MFFVDIGKIAPAFGNRQATQHDDKIAVWDAFITADNTIMLSGIFTVQRGGWISSSVQEPVHLFELLSSEVQAFLL